MRDARNFFCHRPPANLARQTLGGASTPAAPVLHFTYLLFTRVYVYQEYIFFLYLELYPCLCLFVTACMRIRLYLAMS
jgi:hypothetical protein